MLMLRQPDCLGWTTSFGGRRLKVSRVSGGKCNFGPVYGQLYTDGFTDKRAATSSQGNSVVQHRREISLTSLIITYHRKKAQIRIMRGQR